MVTPFPSDVHPAVEWLDHTVDLFVISEEPNNVFHSGCTNYPPTNGAQGSLSPHPHQHLWFAVLLIFAIVTDVKGGISLWF